MAISQEIVPEKKSKEYKDGSIIYHCREGDEDFEIGPETFFLPNTPGYFIHRWGEGLTYTPDENEE